MKLALIAGLLLFAACSNPDNTKPDSVEGSTIHASGGDTISTGATPVMLNGCYAIQKDGDTATLSINLQDSTVTGNLSYRWKEKDRNTGTIKGVVRDSLIVADYTFQSEGMTSVREVIFKISGDSLLEGTGERTERANKIVYTAPQALTFTAMPPFQKIACDK